ncbi:MAG TPA: hypothetical protein VED87_12775 [Methylocystis sp.]|nr:hypothetical protein [Methylocystis sp.]
MAVSAEDLAEMEKLLSSETPVALADMRARFPHLSWTRCDASDVIETPYRSYAQFDVHLLDGGNHCVEVTSEPSRATGVIIAYHRAAP